MSEKKRGGKHGYTMMPKFLHDHHQVAVVD